MTDDGSFTYVLGGEVLDIDIFSLQKNVSEHLINFHELWFNTEEHLRLTAFKG